MEITKINCPAGQVAIKCPYTMAPTRIVVHNTANDASAMAEISYMLGNPNYTSFHYAVDDYHAVQGIEENRNGWHAGDGIEGVGNRQGIGIEICYSLSGGDRFTKAEIIAAQLIASILKRYGWGIDKVTKHQDYSGKYCPHRTLDLGWDRFLGLVSSALRPVWTPMDVPRSMVAIKPVQPVNIVTGELLGAPIDAGRQIAFVTRTTWNGITYLRTQWSTERDLDTGIRLDELMEVPITTTTTTVAPTTTTTTTAPIVTTTTTEVTTTTTTLISEEEIMTILSDKMYTILKWVLLTVMPALLVFVQTLGLNFVMWTANGVSVTVTLLLAALATFLGVIVGISTVQYNKQK